MFQEFASFQAGYYDIDKTSAYNFNEQLGLPKL